MIDWLMYSGCNIIIKLNPLHWSLSFKHNKTNEVWEQDALVIELLPVTIRLWFDNGEW